MTSGPALQSVTVFCGSRFGDRDDYRRAAEATGRTLAERGLRLIYGGGRVGLMGVVADAALAAGGEVVGVIPAALHAREVSHHELTELHVVDSMHERKAVMAQWGDAYLTLPGGAGTLEEFAEQWTWAQLGVHSRRSGLLDVAGFWAPLRHQIDLMVESGFVAADQAQIVTIDDDIDRLLDALAAPPTWGDKQGDHAPPVTPRH